MPRRNEYPLVTVLMAVYNGEKYLREAIESVLTQTYVNFEFLIINDGSYDATEEIILSYSDERIRYVKNEQNLKLIASLNRGLDLAKGKYIARIDADDISLPERLEKQVEFLERHPKVGVLGSWVRTLGLEKNYDVHFEHGNSSIRARLFIRNYIHHPTVVMRKSILERHQLQYPNVLHAEDYAMWIRLSDFCLLDIYPEVLVHYRVHGQNVSSIYEADQIQMTDQLRRMQFGSFNIAFAETEYRLYSTFFDLDKAIQRADFRDLLRFLEKIISKIPIEFKEELRLIYLNSLYVFAEENNCLSELKRSSLYPHLKDRIAHKIANLYKSKESKK